MLHVERLFATLQGQLGKLYSVSVHMHVLSQYLSKKYLGNIVLPFTLKYSSGSLE